MSEKLHGKALVDAVHAKAAAEKISAGRAAQAMGFTPYQYYGAKRKLVGGKPSAKPTKIHSFPISSSARDSGGGIAASSLKISGHPEELAKFLKELAVQFGGER